MMEKGCSRMQHQRGNDHTVDGRQPVLGITTQLGNGHQMADEAANSENSPDIEMAMDRPESARDSPSRSAAVNSSVSSVEVDFDFLWRLRKYLLLLAVLAVSVTYNAGLSPPGGFWTDNSLDHRAGDPLLPVKFFKRYEVFFYCNATAFAASLVLIILLLSRRVASQHVWLRSMQVTMILDLFSLMGAYAAGSCRALRSSVYILVLVFAVFFYVWIHILVFIKIVPNWLKQKVQNFLLQIVKKLQTMLNQVLSICYDSDEQSTSQNGHVPEEQRSRQNEKEEIEEARKFILMLATFAATITYQAGMSPPGGFWAVNGHGYRPATFVLRMHNLARFNFFICCNATSFVASLVTIILLLSMELSLHGIRTLALFVCVVADLLGLIGAYAAGCCRDLATSLSVVFIIVVVFICVLILVMFFQSEAVQMWVDSEVKPRVDKLLNMLSWPRERQLSYTKQGFSQPTHQQDAERANSESQPTHQQDAEQANSDSQPTHQQDAEQASSDSQPTHHEDAEQTNSDSQPTHQQDAEQAKSDSQPTHQQDAEQANLGTEVEQPTDSQQDAIPMGIEVKPRVDKLLNMLSWPRERQLSYTKQEFSQPTHQQDAERANSESQPTHQQDAEQANSDSQPTHQQDAEQASSDSQPTHHEDAEQTNSDSQPTHQQDAEQAKSDSQPTHHEDAEQTNSDSQPTHQQDAEQAKSDSQPTHQQDAEQAKSDSQPTHQQDAEQANLGTEVEQPTDSQQDAIPMGICNICSSTDSLKSIEGTLPVQHSSNQNAASSDDQIIEESPKRAYEEQNAPPISNRDDDTETDTPLEKSNDDRNRHTDDVRLKKSRTYLLLLAILAVSLTYQAGLNPPGGFWTTNGGNHSAGLNPPGGFWTTNGGNHSAGLNPPGGIWRTNAGNHSAGDPILEDSYHHRYLAFFYFNGTAFAASIVMIIMLLNKKMSKKVIKRRALQTAMVTVLLALMGAFVVGSCREKIKSIYISLVIFFVIAYVPLHVWVYKHVIPERWKDWVTQHVWAVFLKKHVGAESPRMDNNQSSGAEEKDLERRRNLLLILAVLAATVTYQAGLNPPGGIWPDDNSNVGKPGNPVMQDSRPKRYDVFYYSNSVSFVSSVALIILLVNRESCEHGIKSYALRVCLVAGLLGLLIAYTAGSCRKVKSIIYLIIIAAAVLFCLVIQVLVLSSTEDALKGRLAWLRRWLRKTFRLEPDSDRSLQSSGRANSESNAPGSVPANCEKKERKRHKYLMLLAIVAASIAYQAGLNPPGGFWSDDSSDGHKAGNPILKDIYYRRYMVFFVFNSISFMASISVILLLLSKSVRKEKVPLQALHFIMILDLLALMTAYAAGSCRKVRTSIFVFLVVCGVVVYLLIVVILLSGIAKWLKKRKGRWLPCCRWPSHVTATDALITAQNV